MKNPRIHAAGQLAHVTVLCVHKHRPGLNEIDIEIQVRDVLTAAGWKCLTVIAEITGRRRAAENGELDLVAFAPWGRKVTSLSTTPWLIEVKRGDRDLTVDQARVIAEAYRYGLRVLIVDDVDLLREWLR